MNDGQYVVQMGDFDQNTYIIQDSNGVQYESGPTLISGDIADGGNIVTEPRWMSSTGRGGKIMGNQSYVNGEVVQVSGTGLNLNTRYTPSSIVLNTSSGNQFEQDSLRLASAVSGSGARGRPRGRKPSRGNFPVVPIDMVRQLGIEQQVILQPTVPVAVKNKGTMTKPISHSIASQFSEVGKCDTGSNAEQKTRIIFKPVFIPVPIPVYIPAPVFVKSKPDVAETTKTTEILTSTDSIEKDTFSVSSKKRKLDDVDDVVESETKHQKLDSSELEEVTVKTNATESCKLQTCYGLKAWESWSHGADILTMNEEELDRNLSLMVAEIKKPNQEAHSCDSIFHFCLGLQLFLIENGRNLNIFTDNRFGKFRSSLNAIVAKYKPLTNESNMLLCRIEEDHLWDAHLLGNYNSWVMLYTVCYMSMKALKLKSAEELDNLKEKEFQIIDSQIVYTPDSNNTDHNIIICQKEGSRDFYTIFQLYINSITNLEGRPENLLLTPVESEGEQESMNAVQILFKNEPVNLEELRLIYNRFQMIREYQESLHTPSE